MLSEISGYSTLKSKKYCIRWRFCSHICRHMLGVHVGTADFNGFMMTNTMKSYTNMHVTNSNSIGSIKPNSVLIVKAKWYWFLSYTNVLKQFIEVERKAKTMATTNYFRFCATESR